MLAAMMALVCLWQTGCVTRRFTVRTNPPGAVLVVDDREIGVTPCSADFTYYGTRKFRLVKEGYETLVVDAPMPTPWYQYVPLDFVTENLVPGEIRDQRMFDYTLIPQQPVAVGDLINRAEGLRRNTHPAGAQPAGFNSPIAPLMAPEAIRPGAPQPLIPPGAVQPGAVQPGALQPGGFQPVAPQPVYAPPMPPQGYTTPYQPQ